MKYDIDSHAVRSSARYVTPDDFRTCLRKRYTYFVLRLVRVNGWKRSNDKQQRGGEMQETRGFIYPHRDLHGAEESFLGSLQGLDDGDYRREIVVLRQMQTVQPS